MTAPTNTTRPGLRAGLNGLRLGDVYRATTRDGSVTVGEYLGMEGPHGDWAILLRHAGGTASIPLADLDRVGAVASTRQKSLRTSPSTPRRAS